MRRERSQPVRAEIYDSVSDAVWDGAGGWFIQGEIASVGGFDHSGFTHLKSNGRLDRNWHVRVGGTISAFARHGKTLYIGGDFIAIDGAKRLGLAALDTTSGELLPWHPTVTARNSGGYVSRIVVSGDGRTIYVAGSFTRVNKYPRRNVAAVTSSGLLTRWHPFPNSDVSLLALDPRGKVVYLAGSFDHVGSEEREGLASVDVRSGLVTSWNPDTDGTVNAIAVAPKGSPVYVAETSPPWVESPVVVSVPSMRGAGRRRLGTRASAAP